MPPLSDMEETALRRLARWASGLTLEQIPERVRQQAINQVLSTLAAVYSGWASDLGGALERAFGPALPGPARILPTGIASQPAHAALLMSSWSMVLDFDDVMLGGHTGHSSVLVPLAIASAGGRSGAELILAQIAANEVAARISMVCATGSTRGQMATYLHLLAAATARAKLERLDEDSFGQALGFAISYPSQALYPAFLGSDAKALCAGLPIRVGMEAVDAVRAGLTSASDPLDDPHGFFHAMTRLPVRDFLGGLGERWHTETNSYKVYPACGYICAALDATLELVRHHDVSPSEVASVEVWTSLFAVAMDTHSAPYLDGPRSRISTLTFSTPFTVASAILAREFGPDQLKRPWIENPRVWELAGRVKSHLDINLTVEALTADIPVGAALRRLRRVQSAAFGWKAAGIAFGRLGRCLQPATVKLIYAMAVAAGDNRPMDFKQSTKALGARVDIQFLDGRKLSHTVAIPRGFAGAAEVGSSEPRGHSLVREKFLAAAGTVIGFERATEVARLIDGIASLSPTHVARLIDRACIERTGN